LLEARRLHGGVLDGDGAGDFGGAASVHDAVVADEVADYAESIVERALRLIDDLR
jgi:hypothetical protein